MRLCYSSFLGLILLVPCLKLAQAAETSNEDLYWPLIRESYFENKEVQDGESLIHIDAPEFAEDASIVPFSIKLTPDSVKKIRKVYLFIDGNPVQLTTTLHAKSLHAPFQLATRIRLEKNSWVRVITEDGSGQLLMQKVWIKTAGGGCGGGISHDEAKLRAEAGRIKIQFSQESSTLKLNIKHPMRTGFERTLQGYYAKAYHIKRVDIHFGDEVVMGIDVGVGISADPYFEMTLEKPNGSNSLLIKATDNENKITQQQLNL